MKKYIFKSYISLIIIGIVSISASSCKSKAKTIQAAPISSIQFIENQTELLADIIERSEKDQKLIFVDFHADWCLPCKILDEEVFNQREVFQFFNKNFINYKVDIEKSNGANLKLMYGADELPSLLFLDSKGRVVHRNNGPVTHVKLMNMARTALAK